jgi:PIN domain nuclease of toxin-antitoxin system
MKNWCAGNNFMRLLIDTHALLWWLTDDPALPAWARKHLVRVGNTILVSSASAWEIATKFRIGKLPDAGDLLADFGGYLAREHFEPLPISTDHAVRAGLLPEPHKDSFDRMLIAQAQAESVPILSNDAAFDTYSVRRLW